jgi:hypothetical protein
MNAQSEDHHKQEVEKLAEILRGMVQYEAEQVHRRISWHGTLHGLLFASLALGWGKSHQLSVLTAWLGIAVSMLVFCGLLAGVRSGVKLRKRWFNVGPEGKDSTLIFGYYPDKHPWSVYLAPELIIPIVFIVAWWFIRQIAPLDSLQIVPTNTL